MRKRGARIVTAEVGHGQLPTEEAVRRAALMPTSTVRKAAYIREEVIEDYLRKQVKKRKECCAARKFVSPGWRGVSDQLVIWGFPLQMVHFVETKPPEGYDLQTEQKREHKRMNALGHRVYTLYTKSDVDEYFRVHDMLMGLR